MVRLTWRSTSSKGTSEKSWMTTMRCAATPLTIIFHCSPRSSRHACSSKRSSRKILPASRSRHGMSTKMLVSKSEVIYSLIRYGASADTRHFKIGMLHVSIERGAQVGNDPEIMRMFNDVGAIVTDSHFVYTSGRHSSVYVNKDAVYADTGAIAALCERMARPYDADEIDVVVGPVLGGIVLSQWVTQAINQRRTAGETLAVFAEKGADGVDKQFFFGRG